MAVKIRLKRLGKVRVPKYRIVVVDSRKKRDGKVLEEIGKYHPKEDPSYVDVVSDRVQYWLGVGAKPSDTVARLLELTGDWQKFKGIGGAEGTLKSAEAKRDKLEIFNEALKEVASEPKADAVTTKKKTAAKSDKSEDKADKSDDKADKSEKAEKKDAAPAEETKAEETKAEDKAEKAAEKADEKADAADESAGA